MVDVFIARPFNSRSILNIGRRAGKPGNAKKSKRESKQINRASSSTSSSSYLAPTRWTNIIQIPVHHHRVRRTRRVDVAASRFTDTHGCGGGARAVDGSTRVTPRYFYVHAAASRRRDVRRTCVRRAHRADAVKRSMRRDAW